MAELFKAASYLQCKPLMHIIGLHLAVTIFFEDSSDSYTTAKARLHIPTDISVEDEERYTKLYR